jgi:cytochrome d ubiquinol oxidase subunit II
MAGHAMSLELALGGVLLAALTLYVVTGGADFGGGLWDLFATGPRAARQRALIAQAIGPIWEANHVWLILVIVILFVCWPPAYARLSIALHVPLSLMLLGIVMRGSAFVFRSYGSRREDAQRLWSRVFAIASLVTPLTFGMSVGAIASGDLHAAMGADPSWRDLVRPWTRPFPVAVGVLTVALFGFLAATYLTLEGREPDLREDFRRRGLVAGTIAAVLAIASLALARSGARPLFGELMHSALTPLVLGGAGLAAFVALGSLALRRYAMARAAAAAFAALLLWGWALAQYPRLIEPDVDLFAAAAPRAVLRPVLIGVIAGFAVLVPSLSYLFRVFKGRE